MSEFMSNKCTHVYASVKYLIISNSFLKRICISETSRIFILNMPSKTFLMYFFLYYTTHKVYTLFTL